LLLHIGADKSISQDEIVIIMDLRAVNKSAITREFIENSKSNVMLATSQEQEVKSVIITEGKIYLSAISSITLKKRLTNMQTINEMAIR